MKEGGRIQKPVPAPLPISPLHDTLKGKSVIQMEIKTQAERLCLSFLVGTPRDHLAGCSLQQRVGILEDI